MTTFPAVPESPRFPAIEEAILQQWRDTNAFQRSLELSANRKPFAFYDGPPFATGLPHYGHILAGTIKDVVTRYASQTGHHVERRFGWDCHGLPVEFEIDKELGVKQRSDIVNKIGIANYNEKCRSIVLTYVSEWKETVERSGRWIDFDNDYKTMQPTFMESIWWVFSQLFQKGLVYRDFKVMPYSTACSTPLSNFEAGQNYKDVSDPSVVVSFPVIQKGSNPLATSLVAEKAAFLAWTTTPWTLPANMALCVNPEFEYVKFRVVKSGQVFIAAVSRFSSLLKEMKLGVKDATKVLAGTDSSIVEVMRPFYKGSELVGLEYEPLFDFFQRNPYWAERSWRVLSDGYVTSDSGTGIVHQAPAFGEDDNRVCHAHGVIERGGEVPCHVDESGLMMDPVDHPDLKGVYVKDADKVIKDMVKKAGRLLVNDTIKHSYPHCWRSDTPLLYRAVPSWFVRVEELKETLLANNKETRWVPAAVQEKRFHNWLADARDWCVSRNRFWGTPLPLWVSKDFTQIKCLGSIAELQQYTDKPITDIHRHFIDDIEIPDPRGSEYPPLRRVDEVFDCWFESGSMPYAQLHYPFENQDKFKHRFPADFVGEGLDQTRGWFYTLSVLGAALFGKAPFKNLIVNGLVLAKDGKKMSKRLKNYPPPSEVFADYGADALRLFLVSSPVVRAESVKFNDDQLKDILKTILLPWFHATRFLTQEVTRYELGGDRWHPTSETSVNVMDQWILSLTQSLIKFVHTEMKQYKLYTALPKLLTFLDQLTNWYVRLNRERMRGDPKNHDCLVAQSTLFQVLMNVTVLMAPFTPFLAEYLYGVLKCGLSPEQRAESVHHVQLPEPQLDKISTEIESSIATLQDVVLLGRQLRDKFKCTIKTPLRELKVISDNQQAIQAVAILEPYIKEELNVLDVQFLVEDNRIQLSCLPNLKLLGTKYGKDLKDLIPKIKQLTHQQLKELERTDNLVVGTHVLSMADVILQRSPMGFEESENLGIECNSEYVVVADFEVTEELKELTMAREIATRVQKFRKELGLSVADEPIMTVESSSPVFRDFFTQKMHLINASLRRELRTGFQPTASHKVLGEQNFELNGQEILIKFFE